jgi:hypothetical protein
MAKPTNELKRPEYWTVSVRRACQLAAQQAMAEVGEDTLDFVSKSVAQRSERILQRRDRRIAREQLLKACPSSPSLCHSVATSTSPQS